MKQITLLLLGIIVILNFEACGASKKIGGSNAPVVGEKEIVIPCSDVRSDKEFFRSNQSATSQDMGMSRDKALLNAKTRLASQIESKIKNVMQSYRNEVTAGGAQEFNEKVDGEARDITNQSLSDINVVCEKVTKSPDGRFNTYLAIEMKKDNLLNKAANRVSQNDKLKVAYDEKKFREIFDKEMDQLAEDK